MTDTKGKETGVTARAPRLDEEPEIVKFIRVDAVQYEGEWQPEDYDPELARATFESSIEDVIEAEELGFDCLMTTEHHFDGWTMVPSPMVYLAAIARETSKIRLGQAVQVLSVHNPWRLAEEAGMLDMLSNGRMEMGVGKGNFSVERVRYTPDESELQARFDEGLELLLKALRSHSITFTGKYTTISEPSTVYPRPFDPEMRLWMPAMRPDDVERVGRIGQNLYGFLSPDGAGTFERYVEAAQAAGHQPSGANYMVTTSIIIAPTDAEAIKSQTRAQEVAWDAMIRRGLPEPEAEAYLPVFGGAIVGSPQTVLDQLSEGLLATRARRLALAIRLRGIPEQVARQTQRLFASEVMPHLRDLSIQTG
jgi:alkanesulfonate monooxygenase SsuD/methylene tetrahydromethanopterin reductase-like flavin-dependent oxidoreductase (luciferase family)